jgi:isopenicillin-N epimerase
MHQFLLEPNHTFLNFGSFGACPQAILDEYQRWQRYIEYNPVRFFKKESIDLLLKSRETLANYIGCQANEVVYVTNPSYAVNIVAKSFNLSANDEVLTTNIEYGACDKTWEYYCQKSNAKYIKANITLPLIDEATFVTEFFKHATVNTKLIFISHITSSTALRLPVEAICAKAKAMGIPTFVDGAHAPGHVPINLQHIDFYTGACHKWMMAPKGCSFLYCTPSMQAMLHPLLISWGFNSPFKLDSVLIDNHQLQGTRDVSAFITLPACIDYMQTHNWEIVKNDCRQLVYDNALKFSTLLNTPLLAPLQPQFINQMLSLAIQPSIDVMELEYLLMDNYKITIPIMPHNDKVYIRYSIQIFNTQDHLNNLYTALQELINNKTLVVS